MRLGILSGKPPEQKDPPRFCYSQILDQLKILCKDSASRIKEANKL